MTPIWIPSKSNSQEIINMKNVVFWNMALCRSWVNRRFGGTYRLHLQGSHLLTLVLHSLILLPWRWRLYVPPKLRVSQDLHSATSQKTTFFLITDKKTSHLTIINMLTATENFKHDEAIVQERRDKSRGAMKCSVLEVDNFLLAMVY
jgi:hypothetical protein